MSKNLLQDQLVAIAGDRASQISSVSWPDALSLTSSRTNLTAIRTPPMKRYYPFFLLGSEIAPSFLDALGSRYVLPFELDGRQHPVPCMLAGRIVEHLDVVEHVRPLPHPACGRPCAGSARA